MIRTASYARAAGLLPVVVCLATAPAASQAVSAAKHDALHARFEQALQILADGVDGSVAYAVVDLETGRRVAHRDAESFPTASTIKIGILYELFRQADEGRVVLDRPAPVPAESRAGGSGILQELEDPVISLRDHALLMILLSDNTSTNVLIDTLGRDAINARMQGLGASSYKLQRRMMDAAAAERGDENVCSAADLLVVMDALRTGKGLAPASRDAAIAILRRPGPTALRAGVPGRVPVAAKPGGLDGVRAEVAWVALEGRPYMLAVMTSFLADEAAASQVLTEMSRTTYQYFSRLARAGVEGRLLSPAER